MQDELNRIKAYIAQLDFRMVLKKMCTQGWTEKQAHQAIQQYKNMLFLWKKYSANNHHSLPPSIDIDEVWHNHILDTQTYQQDCETIFGRYLHHYPYFGMDEATDGNDLNRAFEKTKLLYRQEFGQELYKVRINYAKAILGLCARQFFWFSWKFSSLRARALARAKQSPAYSRDRRLLRRRSRSSSQ